AAAHRAVRCIPLLGEALLIVHVRTTVTSVASPSCQPILFPPGDTRNWRRCVHRQVPMTAPQLLVREKFLLFIRSRKPKGFCNLLLIFLKPREMIPVYQG